MKWCACVGLRRVSLSIGPNIAMTVGDERRDEEKREGWERRGEERKFGPPTPPSAAPVYLTVRALCNLDRVCSEDRHIWKHKQCPRACT